jgi:archaeosortase B (VPXXXP-CTERM-specific)
MADDENEQAGEEAEGGDAARPRDGDGPPPPEEPAAAAPAPRRDPPGRIMGVWRNPAYRFVLLFLPYLGLVSVGYPLFVRHYNPVIQWFILKTAQIEYWLFRPFTSEVQLQDKLVFFGVFAVKIIDECTGIYEMLIFSAAVLAFPTTWAKKGLGLALGCPLIYVFNVLRIAVLIGVGRFWPKAFDFMHLYFWQATMIVMITVVWLLWITVVVRHEKDRSPAPA